TRRSITTWRSRPPSAGTAPPPSTTPAAPWPAASSWTWRRTPTSARSSAIAGCARRWAPLGRSLVLDLDRRVEPGDHLALDPDHVVLPDFAGPGPRHLIDGRAHAAARAGDFEDAAPRLARVLLERALHALAGLDALLQVDGDDVRGLRRHLPAHGLRPGV